MAWESCLEMSSTIQIRLTSFTVTITREKTTNQQQRNLISLADQKSPNSIGIVDTKTRSTASVKSQLDERTTDPSADRTEFSSAHGQTDRQTDRQTEEI